MPLANWGGGGWGGGGGVVEVENIEKEVITMMKIITLMPCSTKLIAQVIKKKWQQRTNQDKYNLCK